MAGPRVRSAAVITAQNEAKTLPQVLRECKRLGIDRMVVVVNGSTDDSQQVAQAMGAHVITYPDPVGHDVGRALGARCAAGASVLLFLDGDLVIPARDLIPFLQAVRQGVDVALNDLDPFCTPRSYLHTVMTGKRFLNMALGRPDLGCATLTAVPHALSRRALRAITDDELAVPPVAQVRAVLAGLRVEKVHPVDVIRPNPRRPGVNTGPGPATVEKLILGDHLEALAALVAGLGPRASFTDLGRRRDLLQPEGSSQEEVRQ